MREPEHNKYPNETALRHAVERKARRSLSDAEWALIAPDWVGPYDDLDVTEKVNAVRESLPLQAKRSSEDSARLARRAYEQRIALEAREMVEAFREELFGQKQPPFPDQGGQAAEWIEDQARVQEFKTKGFYVGIKVPAHLDHLQSLVFLRGYLSENLGRFTLEDRDDGSTNLQAALEECDQIFTLRFDQPVLDYLGFNLQGQIIIKRVHAPDDSLLGRLRKRAEDLCKLTGWEQCSAVHHLLTDGITARHPIKVTSSIRLGRQYYGENHGVVLTITHPDSVTGQDIAAAWQFARSSGVPPWRRQRRRAKPAFKSERVAAFVKQTQGMSWATRMEKWNQSYPEERFRNVSAMKESLRRFNRRR